MPELIPDGVDIPIELREELEEGKVIFFCGAGVSKPSGLPLFNELAEQVITELAIEKNTLLQEAFDTKNYDKVFNLLERPEAENVEPKVLREIVARKLKAKRNADIGPHTTILKLTHDQKGQGKLVTTNFDDLFERAYSRLYLPKNQKYVPDTCPRLPIPKRNSSWNSIVHLHGWIFDRWDPEHKNIVLSSADFGRAYLVERWASRFVTELFRCFTVVFVGYQVEDPVMKYLVDAFSEAKRVGEEFKNAYAFAHYDSERQSEKSVVEKWKSKGEIKALTYKLDNNHSLLWQSLEAWAELHEGGFDSKCAIVTNQAMNIPDEIDKPFIENMIWALSQPDGNIAKVFADMGIVPRDKNRKSGEPIPVDGPPPPIEWLPILDEYGLLQISGKPNKSRIVNHSAYDFSNLSAVNFHLSRWLVRHLDKVEFLNWVLDNGTILHHDFRMRARFALENKEFPIPLGMRKVWNLLLSEDYANKFSARAIRPIFGIEPPTLAEPYSIQRFLNALCPVPKLKKSISYKFYSKNVDVQELSEKPKMYADLSITFIGTEYPDEFIKAIDKSEHTNEILIKIIHPLTDILLEIMDLFNYFGEAGSIDDLSYIHRPSISPHEQNKDYNKWTIVIELLRRAIDACNQSAPEMLELAMKRWSTFEYPVFKRLILYAATEGANE